MKSSQLSQRFAVAALLLIGLTACNQPAAKLPSAALIEPTEIRTSHWNDVDWHPTPDSPGLLQQVLKDLRAGGVDTDNLPEGYLNFLKVAQAEQTTPLYLVDVRGLSPLCQNDICPLLGYIPAGESYEQVLNVFIAAEPISDRSLPLVELNPAQMTSGLPCLSIRQRARQQVELHPFCYDGRQYQRSQT